MDIDWIRRGLERTGKTQRGLARALGIDPSAVSRPLDGKRQPKAAEMAKVAAYLETPPPGYDRRIATPAPTPHAFPGDHGGPAGRLVGFCRRDYAAVPPFDLRLSAHPPPHAQN